MRQRPTRNANGFAKADAGAGCQTSPGGDSVRCLKAGEVPFWWYNGVGPGPLIRVPTDLKWRNVRGKLGAGDQAFVAPNLIVRQKNELPADCAGGATTLQFGSPRNAAASRGDRRPPRRR